MGEKENQPAVGLLLVHGIGSQKRGSVLATCCDALTTWLRFRHGSANVDFLGPRLGLGQDTWSGPPHTELSLPGGRRWLIAESRWAENFIEPTYGRVATWTFGAVLRVAEHHVCQLLRQPPREDSDDAGDALGALRPDVTRFPIAGRHVKAMGLLSVLPLVLIGLVVTSVLRLFPPARPLATRTQRLLTATIGDSYTYAQGLTGRAAMVEQVRTDINWLTGQGVERVVVAGHSQGAAVAYAALQASGCRCASRGACSCPPLDFLTYGSGLEKLTLLSGSGAESLPTSSIPRECSSAGAWTRRLALPLIGLVALSGLVVVLAGVTVELTNGRTSPAALAIVIAGLALVVMVAFLVAWLIGLYSRFWRWRHINRVVGALATSLVLGGAGLVLLTSPVVSEAGLGLIVAAYIAVRVLAPSKDLEILTPHPSRVRFWWDVRSSSDPVASASTRSPGGRTELEVHNLRSVVFDHTSYWQNWSEFVPLVVNAMAATRSSRPGSVADAWEDGGRDPLSVPRFWVARERSRRYEWTWVLADVRIFLTIACVAGLVAALNSLQEIGQTANAVYAETVRLWADDVRSPTSSLAQSLIGAAVVIVAFAVLYGVSTGLWHAWQTRSQSRQVRQLGDLQGLSLHWDEWSAAVKCEDRSESGVARGWLVVWKDGRPRPVSFYRGARPLPDAEEQLEGPVKIRFNPTTTKLCIDVGSGTGKRYFRSGATRSAAFLDRVASDAGHR